MSLQMVKIEIEYLGDLRCKMVHSLSGTEIITDAPIDNHGQGLSFSPTDLAAGSLGTCIATIMGMVAENHFLDLEGMKMTVIKEMAKDTPRRINSISIDIEFPSDLDDKSFQLLKRVPPLCPVGQSLHPDIETKITYRFAGSDKVVEDTL